MHQTANATNPYATTAPIINDEGDAIIPDLLDTSDDEAYGEEIFMPDVRIVTPTVRRYA